ncbi:diguanylate cyclase [Pseudomonas aeruginosa]|nr:diguanylate cyclase [Pseudomonas aeruginosa]
MALILVDVDDFKAYNDHYGHPAGDAALRQLGVVLRQARGGRWISPRAWAGGVRRVALRQRGGQHPGHRRAPAAGGGGAGHRAPGLQRRPPA